MFFVQCLYCRWCETNVCFLYNVCIVGGVRLMYVFVCEIDICFLCVINMVSVV